MKYFSLILVSVIIASCVVKPGTSNSYIPSKTVGKLKFGMSLSSFQNQNKGAQEATDASNDFRKVYLEQRTTGEPSNIVYYFDNEGNKPLYEIILNFESASTRNEYAADLLGAPNSGEEWEFNDVKPYPIKAWKFKEKLIVVGVVPGCEWDE